MSRHVTPVIYSAFGGKDSTALCLWLLEQGLEYRAVHLDTGWEHPRTDEYLREVLPKHVGPIEWITPPRGMVEAVAWKACFPARTGRWCTQQLKIFPMMEWIDREYPGQKLINAVGLRAEESPARAALSEYQDAEWAFTWRPLLRWTVEDVIAIHKRHGVPPNPLYLMGRIDLIEMMEREIYEAALMRYAARGETFESLGYQPPTFFATKQYVELEDGTTVRKNVCTPIRKVVEWSRTTHGGKQVELFYDPDRSGCMRWGLCDG